MGCSRRRNRNWCRCTGRLDLLLYFVCGIQKNSCSYISRDKTGTQQEYGDIFRLMLSIALPVILSTALYNLIELVDGSLFNNIMASKGMEDVKDSMWGAYNAKALLLVHIPVSISSAMAVSLVPTLTAAYALGDEQTARSKVHAILRFISILAFPSAVGLLVLANPIIKTLFSVDTSAASTYHIADNNAVNTHIKAKTKN